MNKVKMIAVVRTDYAGVYHDPGQDFDVSPEFVETLTKLGVARVATAEDSPPEAKKYKRRDMRAEG